MCSQAAWMVRTPVPIGDQRSVGIRAQSDDLRQIRLFEVQFGYVMIHFRAVIIHPYCFIFNN
jgi:hypothetical protein